MKIAKSYSNYRSEERLKPLRQFGYDAVETSTRRKPPRIDVKSEDDHLDATKRRKLVSTARDLRRNYSLAAWMIRQHLNYVASFSFQAKNDEDSLNESLERLVRWWSLKENFDVANRHNMSRFIKIAEASRTVDGDVFFYKMNSGHLQAIEGDRIANSWGEMPDNLKIGDFKRGVKCSKGGRPQQYIVNNRSATGSRLIFHKVVPAKYILPFGYYDRFDQFRGISPLASAVNTLQDTYEGITYALARAKVAQLFALALKRASAEPSGEVTAGENGDDSQYTIDFGKGPIVLELDPDDEATFLESSQPSDQFQQFVQIMIMLSLKALDIPYSFYSEDFTNYSGSRQALLLYEQSAKTKRDDVKELLDSMLRWRLELWAMDGVLVLPRSMTVADVSWEWQPNGIPWIDPLKEVSADTIAVAAGLTSRQRLMKKRGDDFWEVIDEIDAENAALRERGIEIYQPTLRRRT